MSFEYQKTDFEVVDYRLFSIKPAQSRYIYILRGPKPSILEQNNYFACLGAAYTFGRFAEKPYPILLQEKLGLPTLNLGFAGAGPSLYLNNKALIEYANNAKFVIILVMSGRSESNSLYNCGRLAGLHRKSDNKKITAFNAYQELLENYPEEYAREIVNETRNNWIANYQELLSLIKKPKILFWFSQRNTEYTESYKNVSSLFHNFPHMVNSYMIDEIKDYCEEYVECVSKRGMPQLLINRFTGEKGYLAPHLFSPDREQNNYYPSPEMHEHAAEILEPVCRGFVS